MLVSSPTIGTGAEQFVISDGNLELAGVAGAGGGGTVVTSVSSRMVAIMRGTPSNTGEEMFLVLPGFHHKKVVAPDARAT